MRKSVFIDTGFRTDSYSESMTWFERRLADLEAHKQRLARIKQHAPAIYDQVWAEVVAHIAEAKSKGWAVDTNGSPRRRAVMLQKQNKSGDWLLEVILPEGKDRIRVKGDLGIDFYINLEVCPEDDVVCLTLDGSRISIEHAAEAILDPFLFSQLQAHEKGSN